MITAIDRLSQAAVHHGASDIFLVAGDIPRVRINEQVSPFGDAPISADDLAKLWSLLDADPKTVNDHDASFVNTDGHRFRVSLYKQLGRIAAVMRPVAARIPGFDELALPADRLIHWGNHSSGLLLICGATGAGKSTTIAALLSHLNQTSTRHIITLEDPIEYLFTPDQCWFSQREIGTDTPTFATGLRAALRQSPDVIMIGEIRDPETAITALQASETGHLVLATLHSANTTDALERLTNLFPADERTFALSLLASELLGVFCQKLLPSTSDGIVPAYEMLSNEGAVSDWLQDLNLTAISDHVHKSGMDGNISFLSTLVNLCLNGQVTPEVAEAYSARPSEFRRLLRGIE